MGVPEMGGREAAEGRPAPYWRRRRQVRGVLGAGAPLEGQPPRIMLPSCAGDRVLLAAAHLLLREYIKQHQGEEGGQKTSNIWFLARLPLLGPGGLGALMGESGVKFRAERHPPEVGRP